MQTDPSAGTCNLDCDDKNDSSVKETFSESCQAVQTS